MHGAIRERLVIADTTQYLAVAREVLRYGGYYATRTRLYRALRRWRSRYDPRPDSLTASRIIRQAVVQKHLSLTRFLRLSRVKVSRRPLPWDAVAEDVADWLWDSIWPTHKTLWEWTREDLQWIVEDERSVQFILSEIPVLRLTEDGTPRYSVYAVWSTLEQLEHEAEDNRQEVAHERWLLAAEQTDEWEMLGR